MIVKSTRNKITMSMNSDYKGKIVKNVVLSIALLLSLFFSEPNTECHLSSVGSGRTGQWNSCHSFS